MPKSVGTLPIPANNLHGRSSCGAWTSEIGPEGVDGCWGTSAADVDETAYSEPKPTRGQLVEVCEDFEADAMLLVKEFGDGESFVNTDVGAEGVGTQGSSMPECSFPQQPLHGVEGESW